MIQWLTQAGRIISELALALGTRAGNWLRIAIVFLIVWPIGMLCNGMLPYHLAVVWTPIVTLAPLVALVALVIIFTNPLAFAALAAIVLTPMGNRVLRGISAIIGVELLVGIYFSIIPISYDRRLVPLLVLVAVAFSFLRFSS